MRYLLKFHPHKNVTKTHNTKGQKENISSMLSYVWQPCFSVLIVYWCSIQENRHIACEMNVWQVNAVYILWKKRWFFIYSTFVLDIFTNVPLFMWCECYCYFVGKWIMAYWKLILSAWHPIRWRQMSHWNLCMLSFYNYNPLPMKVTYLSELKSEFYLFIMATLTMRGIIAK